MYSYQGKNYTSLNEVPADILSAFINQNTLSESIAIQENTLLFWEEHYFRLMAAMRILRMEIPLTFTPEYLEEEIKDLINSANVPSLNGNIRLSVVKMSKPTFDQPIPKTAYSITVTPTEQAPFIFFKPSLPIDLYKDHYVSTGLYSSIESVAQQWRNMAWTYTHENNYCDGILLNTEKHIVESLTGSLFLVKGDVISTPALDQGCRKTVYREQLLTVLNKIEAYQIKEETISPFSIQKADELFVLGDSQGIISISQYRKKRFKTSTTEDIYALFIAQIKQQL